MKTDRTAPRPAPVVHPAPGLSSGCLRFAAPASRRSAQEGRAAPAGETGRRVRRLAALGATLAIAALLASPLTAEPPAAEARTAAERGIAAYLSGRYADALPDLEKARDGGVATGAIFYMLGYCYDTVEQDSAASSKAFASAQEALQKETAAEKPPIESWFYLSNLALNRHDTDASRKAAEAGVAAIEKGRVKVPKDGTSLFRAGKLYADAGRADQAVEYHRRAVEAFAKMDSPPPEYLRRALETLARAGDTRVDPELAAKCWERLLEQNPNLPNGDWNLGLASLRAGRWSAAHLAFERVRNGGGDRAQDAYYASSVASAAQELAAAGIKIPEKDADKKVIASLDSQALDDRLKEYTKKAGELLAREVKDGEYVVTLTDKGKKRIAPGSRLAREINDVHRYFLALVANLTLRGESLQAKAFEGGYAPLIIQDWAKSWRMNHRELQMKVAGVSDPADGTSE